MASEQSSTNSNCSNTSNNNIPTKMAMTPVHSNSSSHRPPKVPLASSTATNTNSNHGSHSNHSSKSTTISLQEHLAKTKPPLPPEQRGRVQSIGSVQSGYSAYSAGNMSVASDTSRAGLRREVLRRSHSLTTSEYNFLQGIVANGTEVEVMLVQQKLKDPSLCFDLNADAPMDGDDDDDNDNITDTGDDDDVSVSGEDEATAESNVGEQEKSVESTISSGTGTLSTHSKQMLHMRINGIKSSAAAAATSTRNPPSVVELLSPTRTFSTDNGELDGSIDTCATGQGKPPSTPCPVSPRQQYTSLSMPSHEELYPDERQLANIQFSDLEQTPLVHNLRAHKSLEGAAQLPAFSNSYYHANNAKAAEHNNANENTTPIRSGRHVAGAVPTTTVGPLIPHQQNNNLADGGALVPPPAILRRRSSNPLIGQLWRAHESGLTVTPQQSSKRAQMLRREQQSLLMSNSPLAMTMSPIRRYSSLGMNQYRRDSNSSLHTISGGITPSKASSRSSNSSDHARSLLTPQELRRLKQRYFRTSSQTGAMTTTEMWLQRSNDNNNDRDQQQQRSMLMLLQNFSTDSSTTDYTQNTNDISSLMLPTDEEIFRRTVQLQANICENATTSIDSKQWEIASRPPPPRPFGGARQIKSTSAVEGSTTTVTTTSLDPKPLKPSTLRRMSSDGATGLPHQYTRRPSALRRMTSDGASRDRSKSVSFHLGQDDKPLPPMSRRHSATTSSAIEAAMEATGTTSPDFAMSPPTLPISDSIDTMEDSILSFASEYRPPSDIIREKSSCSTGVPRAAFGRRDSATSVASLNLHRAHPVRQESFGSTAEGWIAARAFQRQLDMNDQAWGRRDSMNSVASLNLHMARPLRQDSTGSTLEGADAARAFQMDFGADALASWVRRDSMQSLASLNLHRARPLRQDSIASGVVDGIDALEAFQSQFSSDIGSQYGQMESTNSLASLNLHLAAPIQESIFKRQQSMNSLASFGGAGMESSEAFRPDGWCRRDSMSSLASLNLHPARPIRQESFASSVAASRGYGRRDSLNSIASLNLHHAQPIRQDSIASNAAGFNALEAFRERTSSEAWGRQDGALSPASLTLHRAHPVRRDSIASCADGLEATEAFRKEFSVEPNTVVKTSYGRQDSIGSVASLNLHFGQPLRSDGTNLEILRNQGSAFSEHDLDGDDVGEVSMLSLPPAEPLGQDSIVSTSTGRNAKEALQLQFRDNSGDVEDAPFGTVLSSTSDMMAIHQRSSLNSIPSLHPARPLRQDSIASTADGREAKEQWRKQLGMATVAASEWVGIISPDEWEDKKIETEDILTQSGRFIPSDQAVTKVNLSRPVIMRRASASEYDEEGMEVAALDEENVEMFTKTSAPQMQLKTQILVPEPPSPPDDEPETFAASQHEEQKAPETQHRQDSYQHFPDSLASFGAGEESFKSSKASNDGRSRRRASIETSASFDESKSIDRFRGVFRGELPRSISEDELTALLAAHCKPKPLSRGQSDATIYPTDLNSESWEMETIVGEYDAWAAIRDDYINGYGGGGSLPFRILGTGARDVDAEPHVLSPPLMESLQSFLPHVKSHDNFWMKYSLVRDGASMHTLMQQARGAKYSILAIETVDGEVFGAFTTEAWRKNWSYFGGEESFLWKMRHSRQTPCHSIIDQAQMESEIDVYPYTGANQCLQLCTHNKIAVGGGSPETEQDEDKRDDNDDRHLSLQDIDSHDDDIKDYEWGYGLAIQGDLQHGTSSPCLTFGSPSLSNTHGDGSVFEILNLELWAFTPCGNVLDAEKLELGKLFLEQSSFNAEMYETV